MLARDPTLRLVVLEIGCGLRVPSVRKECEMVVRDAFGRAAGGDHQVHLIRVNPDFSTVEDATLEANGLALSIQARGLETMQRIHRHLLETTGPASEGTAEQH